MEAFGINAAPFFQWLLKTTVQGGVLICLILLIKAVLRTRLPVRWHYYLWLLLLIRLVLPWTPQSRISIFNLVPQYLSLQRTGPISENDHLNHRDAYSGAGSTDTQRAAPISEAATDIDAEPLESAAASDQSSKPLTAESDKPSPDLRTSFQSASSVFLDKLPLIWIIGALALGGCIFVRNFSLWRTVKRERPITDQKILDLLEDCKMQMRVRTIVGVIITDRIKSPALFGFIRPRLVLPQGLIETLSLDELYYVFLHELAHLKRGDIYLGWLSSLLQILHWFNPLIWFAFRRLRADQELACDALALSTMNAEEPPRYGRTIVSLLETFSQRQYLPSVAGILEDKSQLERRIKMMTRFSRKSYRWSPLAMLLLIILGCVSFTDAKRTVPEGVPPAAPAQNITIRSVMSSWGGPMSISPDGKYLCYMDPDTGNLAARDLATGQVRLLTKKSSWEESSDLADSFMISPDSRKVAFEWFNSKENTFELHLIGLDGSDHRIVCTIPAGGWFEPVAWSDDVTRILGKLGKFQLDEFQKGFKTTQIAWISCRDGSMQVVKTLGTVQPGKIELSPDERYLIYDLPQEEGSSNRDIFLFALDKNVETRLVKHPANDKFQGWTPDGRHILFTSDRSGTWDAWLLAVVGNEPQGLAQRVKPQMGDISPIGFTEKGSFYYTFYTLRSQVYIAKHDLETGKILAEPQLVRPGSKSCCPDWSSDGKYLAYSTRLPDRTQNIHIQTISTGEERDLNTKLPYFNCLRWAPDGRFLLATGFNQGSPQVIYNIDIETGNKTVLVRSEKEMIRRAEFSPRGKKIFFVRSWRLLCKDLETGREEEPFPKFRLSDASGWALSPDGQHVVAVLSNVSQTSWWLKLLSLSGEEQRELHRTDKMTMEVIWAPDGQDVIFGSWNNLSRISAAGGEPRKLWEWEEPTSNLCLNPDGQNLAFIRMAGGSEVWVMEDFLPEASVKSTSAKPPSKITLRKVSDKVGLPASISPDGRYLCGNDLNTGNLVVHDLATDKARRLTNIGSFATSDNLAYDSAISPDNKTVAYAWLNDGDFELHLVGLDGSGHRHIPLPEGGSFLRLKWAADGSRIVGSFSGESGDYELTQVSVTDGSMHLLQRLGQYCPGTIDLSPDGRYIAYDHSRQGKIGHRDIFLFDVDNKREIPLVQHPARDWLLGWAPDGNHILFASDRMGNWGLFLMPIAEGKPRGIPELIKPNIGLIGSIGFAPDGSYYYGIQTGSSDVIIAEFDRETGKVLSPPQPVRHIGKDTYPDWSPDGRHLAYCDKSRFIRIRSVETGEEREVAEVGYFHCLRWAPDGKSVLVTGISSRAGAELVYQIDVDSGARSVLVKNNEEMIRRAEISPDGKVLFYELICKSIISRDLEGGHEENIFEVPPFYDIYGWALAPDGQSLVVCLNEHEMPEGNPERVVMVISATGEKLSELLRNQEKAISGAAWMPDGKSVLVAQGTELWRISIKERAPQMLWEWTNEISHLSVHPDGQRMAFGTSKIINEVWAIENFLPVLRQ